MFSTSAIHSHPAVVSCVGVTRHGQADPAALARRVPHGGTPGDHCARREVERRGLLGDVGRGFRAALLLGPRRAALARRAAAVPARRVHGRGAVHASLGAVLPAPARAGGRGARGAADRLLPPRGKVRVRRAAPPRAAEPRARPARVQRGADRDGRAASRCSTPTTRPRRPAGSRSSRTRSRSSGRCASSTGRSRGTRRASGRSTLTRCINDNGLWYVVGHDLDREDDPHLPRLPHPRRHQVRHAARARLPRTDRLRRRGLPRPAAVADRRRRRQGADRGARRHRVVGEARLRRNGAARRRRLRHRVLLHPPARVVGAAPERPRRAARAAGAEA